MLTAQVGLQAADTGLTHYGLTLPDVVERNALMRWATDRPPVMYTVKAGATALIVWHLNRTACRNPRIAFWGTLVLNGALTASVANNYRVVAGAH